MASAISVYARPARHDPATAHEHGMLSLLLLCPEEQCRQHAIALFERSVEDLETNGERLRPNSLRNRLDADERLPGYLRHPDSPAFDSPRNARRGKRPLSNKSHKESADVEP